MGNATSTVPVTKEVSTQTDNDLGWLLVQTSEGTWELRKEESNLGSKSFETNDTKDLFSEDEHEFVNCNVEDMGKRLH